MCNSIATIRRTGMLAVAAALALAGVLASTGPASATTARRPPRLTINGSTTWAPQPRGGAVVHGYAGVTLRSGVPRRAQLTAVITPARDDAVIRRL